MIFDKYKIKTNNITFDLELKDNIVLINGLSGVGKSMLYKAILEDAILYKKPIICLNRTSYLNLLSIDFFKGEANKLFVIDDAEILLDTPMRQYISLDTNNQYMIFTHTTEGFIPTKKSVCELKIENNKGFLDYPFI